MYLMKGYRGDVVKEALARALKSMQGEEKGQIEDRKLVYKGKLSELIKQKIKIIFTNDEEQRVLEKFISSNVNVLKYVIDEVCRTYRYGCERQWNYDEPKTVDGKVTTSDDAMSKRYKDICEISDLDENLDHVDKMTMLCHDVILRHKYTKFGHSWFPMTRDMCDVVQSEEDFKRITGVIWYEIPTNTPIINGNIDNITGLKWHYATADEFKVYDKNFDLIPAMTTPNPYKKLNDSIQWPSLKAFYPFFDFHDGIRENSFWRDVYDEALLDAAAEVGVWLTYLNGQLKFSTFKQLFETSPGIGSGGTGAEGGTQKLSWLHAYKAPLGGNLGVIDYTVNLKMTLDCLQDKLSMLAICFGLPGNAFQLRPTREPGMTFVANRGALNELRQGRESGFIKAERAIGRTVQFTGNVTGGNFENYPQDYKIDQKLNPDKMTVNFQEAEKQVDPKEDREHWDWLFEKGLANFSEYLVEKNPDISVEEAKKRVEINTADLIQHQAKLRQASDFGLTGSQARNKLKTTKPNNNPTE